MAFAASELVRLHRSVCAPPAPVGVAEAGSGNSVGRTGRGGADETRRRLQCARYEALPAQPAARTGNDLCTRQPGSAQVAVPRGTSQQIGCPLVGGWRSTRWIRTMRPR
jgi:hypothetical protein